MHPLEPVNSPKLSTGYKIGNTESKVFLMNLSLQFYNEMVGMAVVVTVLAEDNKKYLSTDLLNEEPKKKDFLSPNLELIDFRAF